MSERPPGAALSRIALMVRDYDESIAFLRDGLGFALAEDTGLGGEKRWVRMRAPGGGSELLLARASDPAQGAFVGDQCGGRVFLFLETDDFERDRARIEAAGGVFEAEPRHERYGIVAVFRDPSGNRWDLIQPPG